MKNAKNNSLAIGGDYDRFRSPFRIAVGDGVALRVSWGGCTGIGRG